MKKVISFISLILLFFAFAIQPTYASKILDSTSIEYLEDGSYYETIIEDSKVPFVFYDSIQPLSTNTVTNTKTTYYKNAAGEVLWYVRVTGTFTYGDGTSKCTAATPSAASQSSTWKVSNISGSKYGNKASATATGKQYYNGSVVTTKTKTVTLTCSATGVFS